MAKCNQLTPLPFKGLNLKQTEWKWHPYCATDQTH